MPALTLVVERLLRVAPVFAALDTCALAALAYFVPPRNSVYVLSGAFLGVVLFLVDLLALRYRPALFTVASIALLMVEFVSTMVFLPPELTSGGADFLLHPLVAVTVQYLLLFALRHRVARWLQRVAAA